MRFALKAVLVVIVAVGVGVLTARTVLSHHANAGAYEPQVKLGADMAGLFAGGAAGLLAIIAVVRLGSRER